MKTIELGCAISSEEEARLKAPLIAEFKMRADRGGPDSPAFLSLSDDRRQILQAPIPYLSNPYHHQEACAFVAESGEIPPVRRNALYGKRVSQMIDAWRGTDGREFTEDYTESFPIATYLETAASLVVSISAREATTEVIEYGVRIGGLNGFLYYAFGQQHVPPIDEIINSKNPNMLYYFAAKSLSSPRMYLWEPGRLVERNDPTATRDDNAPNFPDVDTITRRMKALGVCWGANDRCHFPVIAFLAEEMLDRGMLSEFVLSIFDGTEGVKHFNLAARLVADVYFNSGVTEDVREERYPERIKDIYLSLLRLKEYSMYYEQSDPLLIQSREILSKVEHDLWRRASQIVYPLRPAVIASEVLTEAAQDPVSFWQIIFNKEVQPTMEGLFTGNGKDGFRPIYDAAMKENMMQPVKLLIFAHLFGLDREVARVLAATNFMAWGAIKGIDEIVDNEKIRKGIPTPLAKQGLADTLEASLLAFGEVLETTLHDKELSQAFVNMLRDSCRADIASRQLDWSSSYDQHLQVMAGINEALSWFPIYFGNQAEFVEAGRYLAEYNAKLILLGQLISDVHDVMPTEITEESGKDFGTKVTLPLKALVELTQEKLPDGLKDGLEADVTFIKEFFETERQRNLHQIPEQKDTLRKRRQALVIGKKYQTYAVFSLLPLIEEIYNQARKALDQGFAVLPEIDEVNQKYYGILSATLETMKKQLRLK